MQIKISRDYSVSFTNEEVIDALCYLLSHFRSTPQTTQICSLIRNSKGAVGVLPSDDGVTLEFTYLGDIEDEY